jgi:phosphoglycolate phosphatase
VTAPRARLVVFDLDGTLIDSSRDLAAAVNRALRRRSRTRPPSPKRRALVHRQRSARPDHPQRGRGPAWTRSVDEVLSLFLEEYRRGLLDATRLYPGTEDALDRLRDRPLAVLTNKPGDMSRTILEGLGVAGRFFRIYGAGDVDSRKPDPAGLKRIAEEAGVDVQAAVMVGDSGIDVLTGRAAGALTAGVTYGFDVDSFRDHPPDLLVRSLTELADRLS